MQLLRKFPDVVELQIVSEPSQKRPSGPTLSQLKPLHLQLHSTEPFMRNEQLLSWSKYPPSHPFWKSKSFPC